MEQDVRKKSRRILILIAVAGLDVRVDFAKCTIGCLQELVGAGRSDAVLNESTPTFATDEATTVEAIQVHGGVGLGQASFDHKCAHIHRAVAKRLEDLEARSIGESAEELRLQVHRWAALCHGCSGSFISGDADK
jgi:hypothetical protein